MKIKAIIPAAGHGTRFAPFTKLIPKEMLPIGSRPAIDLIVREAAAAGADEIIIITSREKPLIEKWFSIEPPPVKLTYVYQEEQRGLGHAVYQASTVLKDFDGKILVLLGDALVSGCDAAKEMTDAMIASSAESVIGLELVEKERVSRYGIVKLDSGVIVDMVEKPSVEEAPSLLAVAGRYILDASVFKYLADQTEGVGGEIQLTDAIKRMLKEKKTIGYVYPGHRHDIGNPTGYLKALEAYNGSN